jgi:hypothetical protein
MVSLRRVIRLLLLLVPSTAADNADMPPYTRGLREDTANEFDAAIAKQADPLQSFSKSMTGFAKLLGESATGQQPSSQDFVTFGATVLGDAAVALGVTNPVVAIALAFGASFFGGLIGTSSDYQEDIYRKIMDQLPSLVQSEVLKEHLQTSIGIVEDFMDESKLRDDVSQYNLSAQIRAAETLEGKLNDHKREIFLTLCWNEQYDAGDCKQWHQFGTIAFEVVYADLHVKSLMHAAYLQWNDAQTRNTYIQKFNEYHRDYLSRLNRSLSDYTSYRLSLLQDTFPCDKQTRIYQCLGSEGNCAQCFLDCTPPTDTFPDANPQLPVYRKTFLSDSDTCYFDKYNNEVAAWKAKAQQAWDEYKAPVLAGLQQLDDLVSAFSTMTPNAYVLLSGDQYCSNGYYGGNCNAAQCDDTNRSAAASLQACKAQCSAEDKCKFIAYKFNVCSRYDIRAGDCSARMGDGYQLY